MKYWARKVIKNYCNDFGYKSVCQISARGGGAAEVVLELSGVRLVIIDPWSDIDLREKYLGDTRVTVHKGLSLEIIPKLTEKFDSILIDGDHNWYTVFNELRAIEEKQLLKAGGTIFLHDVAWPYGRRDMYYNPEVIPKQFCHAYARKGIIYGRSKLSLTEGLNKELDNAEEQGGLRNGVLTAVEDFLSERGQEYLPFFFKDEFGLGVLVKPGGMNTKRPLVKWHMICLTDNVLHSRKAFKRVLKRHFPHIYGGLKALAGKA